MPTFKQEMQQISQVLGVAPVEVMELTYCQLERDPKSAEPLTSLEEFALVIYSWLRQIIALSPDQASQLLREMLPYLRSLIDGFVDNWQRADGPEGEKLQIPAQTLECGDNTYFAWNITHDTKMWDARCTKYVEYLKRPPTWRTSLLLAGAFFSYLARKQLYENGSLVAQTADTGHEEDKDVNQASTNSGAAEQS